ncbi:peptidylprolyl isomerase [Enterococcus olivae]
MKKKKISLFFTAVASMLLLSACSTSETQESTSTSSSTSESSVDLSTIELPQLDSEVKENESLVEIVTTEGTVTVKLFPEYAPKAVENFMTHAKDGYYDGLVFHRVIEDFMIQGGDPQGNGSGGESIWGEGFEVEISPHLYHIRGALAMARSTALDSQGSQFFIVQNNQDASKDLAIQFTPEQIIEAYKDGGYPSLDGNYTVFGQVIEGMDVVDQIATAEKTDEADASGSYSIPLEPVKIETIHVLQEAK